MTDRTDATGVPARLWRALRSLPSWLAGRFGVVSALAITFLALLITAEIVMRAVSGVSITGLYEISELILVVIVFLGLPQAEVAEDHVRVVLVVERFRPRVAGVIRGVALLASGAFLGWMCVALAQKAVVSVSTGEFRPGLIDFPIWPARIVAAVGVALIALVCLEKGLKLVLGRPVVRDAPASESGSIEGGEG